METNTPNTTLTNIERILLCDSCAADLGRAYEVTKTDTLGMSEKCAYCHKRRYVYAHRMVIYGGGKRG